MSIYWTKMKEAGGMIVNDDARRPEAKAQKPTGGWTSLHSWIFLAIVAIGLTTIGIQNRYHYLSPLGLGKAYRIDKLFGGIQEFDPTGGWITAQLQVPPPPTMPMGPPQPPGSPAIPMNGPPGTVAPSGILREESVVKPSPAPQPVVEKEEVTSSVTEENISVEKPAPDESPVEEASVPETATSKPPVPELTDEDKFAAFKKQFPDFGKDEFQLANDDLYPDWKKQLKPDGTWEQFLGVYGDFIEWWTDSGSPSESGFTLWRKFLTDKSKQ
jgi:hypothetical protein